MSEPTVIGALRKFLPAFRRKAASLPGIVQRAIWAITHCRTPVLGGHLYACDDCDRQVFAYHSCNHRNCPQCGGSGTAQWVERELEKRVGAPYFMVTFTLPSELRHLFFGKRAKDVYDLFFAATSSALAEKLGKAKGLRAERSGFTGVLHTWNQRLGFHPHIHYIVPGAGIDAEGKVVTVKNANFLMHLPLLQQAFRWHFAGKFQAHREATKDDWPRQRDPDPGVWDKEWGVHIKPFGDGANAIKYLGRYVCRSVISDARIVDIGEDTVTYRWKDRDKNRTRTETIHGVEFVRRYLRHVLPRKLRVIRYFGFCHPAAKATRERIAFHTGKVLRIGAAPAPAHEEKAPAESSGPWPLCPCCRQPMKQVEELPPGYKRGKTSRAPPAASVPELFPIPASS